MTRDRDEASPALETMVSPAVVEGADRLRERFAAARPFRHVAIDDFFTAETARALAERFPAFDERLAMNENGEVGAKAVNEKVRDLGGPWVRLDDLVRGQGFRDLVSRMTGIPDLQYDPHYFGGGTHENLHGQCLDAHVDFNFHPLTRQHRRLNLIVYLSEEWRDEWGGSIQLHKDPYLPPSLDEITVVTPLFNRCVIFETNEHSWHGFPRIELPENKRHLSRRSFALYYYTDSRPAQELGPEHSTIYVEEHLPDSLRAGEPLSEQELQHIRNLVASRDQHLRRLYGNIKQLYTELNGLRERYGLQPAPGVADESPEDAGGASGGGAGDAGPVASQTGSAGNTRAARGLEAELERRSAALRRLEDRVRELENSTSWRLTRPLRRLKRLLGAG